MSLPALGVAQDVINFRNVTMQSDQAICVREETGGKKTVAIIDVTSNRVANRMPMGAESAILSSNAKLIAVRAAGTMQVYNLESQTKVKTHKMADGEAVAYWTWVDSSTVGIVTSKAVYHWTMQGDAAPSKLFDRHATLEGTQVITHDASPDRQWMMVAGIKAGAAGGPAAGCMQLYSMERKLSQTLSAHAGCFTTFRPKGRSDDATLFCFVQMKPGEKAQLMVIEVSKPAAGTPFRLPPQSLPVPADASADFPVAVKACGEQGIVYIVTKMGYVYVFDLQTGGVIFRKRFSTDPVFTAAYQATSNGVLALSVRSGTLSLITLNHANLVPYITTTLRNSELAMELAGRLGLAGADGMYKSEFERMLSAGDVEGAAKLAASSPGGALRNAETIERFKALPTPEGGQAPVLKYFAQLMQKGKLNKVETVELTKPALAQGRSQLLEKWLREDTITCSEQLGDMVAPYDAKMALSIYLRSGEAHEKVVNCFMSTGEFAKIVPYASKHAYTPNYKFLLQNMVHQNPKAAQEFAVQLGKNPSGPLLEIPTIVDVFMGFSRLQECTAFLLEVLSEDKPEQGYLQTKLLEMNLLGGAPQVADAVLGGDMLHHFDKQRVAELCEKAQLYQRALELYTGIEDIKRVLTYAQTIPTEALVNFFSTMNAESCLLALDHMLSTNPRGNMKTVVEVAQKYHEQLTAVELIRLFEAHGVWDGMFYFLGRIVNTSEDPEVHFKYIVAAANLKQFKEVERVCRDSTIYNAEQVKDFLLDQKLPDPRPLIHVCDRHGYEEELTGYLWNNNLRPFIEVYVQKVGPTKTPVVVGRLLDLDAEEDFIKGLLVTVGHACPVEPLVAEVEQRNRLRLLQGWLEARVAEGNTEAATHNAIGKIFITLNKDPVQFLKNNQFYDSLVVGQFCEKLDPYLAYLAYRRAGGACDEELIEVTSKNGLFKDQARYLVERQDMALWAKVLSTDNHHRQDVVDQVTGTALPEAKSPEQVSTTVKAFMAADMPQQLIGLLEKLVLHGGDFSDNRNLQNLLILTAIKCAHEEDAEEGRTMEYINRLDNFDGEEIAKIALQEEYQLFEEALAIYKKFKMHLPAVRVLLDNIEDLDRAGEFAERVDESDVWSALGGSQMRSGMVKECIESYIKAEDASQYMDVIAASEGAGQWEDLVSFLHMAREKMKERVVDTELVYALAHCNRLGELEQFITSPNVADIQSIGDKCFDEEMFEAAKLLFASINNNSKLAVCLVRLGSFKEAVDAAKKANSVRTWKEVNAACVAKGEFRLAQVCGLHIIMSPDHLEELILQYETFGHTEELMKLMEQGVGQETAHSGIFTELGVLYSKYRRESLMEHIKIYWSRMNVSRMLRACEDARAWPEAVFLYIESEDFDQAVRVMMEHSPSALDQGKFLEVIQKVRNTELYYKAIIFFLDLFPLQLEKLLKVLTPKLDHARVVHLLRKQAEDALPLILPYLLSVQKENISAVNEAVNELLVAEEDYERLRTSIDEHDNFDQIALASSLENHELLECRRIAALLYKRNKKWGKSIKLSKDDGMFEDAIDTAAASGEQKSAEGLLRFFVGEAVDGEEGKDVDAECFCACLYTCYPLIRPDVALELAWRHRILDFAMPFLVQFVRDATGRLEALEKKLKPSEDAAAGDAATQAAMEAAAMGYLQPGVLQIANSAYNPGMQAVYPGAGMPGQPGYNGGYPGAM
jgi:clathrin heavy chain